METNDKTVSKLLDAFLTFEPKQIPENTRFWMIRTKKGYFYHEFVSKNYVALAWNIITSETDFGQSELLSDNILLHYKEIKRPTLVINKCKSFINEISVGDILVIPSEGSRYITFAYAGEYYEEPSKTYELETTVIDRIEERKLQINEISCPYKKRRHIIPIRTIRNEIINYHLLKAISSYHGISNLDEYSTTILDHLFNCYTFKNNMRLVFHVSKTDPITSKELSGFLYSINTILSTDGIDEHDISAQASVHSVGDIVFTIKNVLSWMSSNYIWFIALAVIIGGGKFLTVELPGLPKIIKDFISIKSEKEIKDAELTEKRLENYNKAFELRKKMQASGISLSELESLEAPLEILSSYSASMQITPINTARETNATPIPESFETDNEEETL